MEQQINLNLCLCLCLSSSLTLLKNISQSKKFFLIEAHAKRTKFEYERNALANFHGKAATTESVKIVPHMNEVHPASAKSDPTLPDFCPPDVLVICRC